MSKIHKKLIFVIILALFLFFLGLVWLGVIFFVFIIIYYTSLKSISLIRFSLLRKIVKGVFLFVFLLSSVISFKLLVLDVYKIPSSSMENILYSGDVIVINKLQYGPRLPRSPFEIPWVNMAFYVNHQARARIKEVWWDYIRWNGTARIKQGDVFVFSLKNSLTYFVVKRCVGLPGDTIQIKNGEIYTNSVYYNSPKTVKNNYSFRIKNKVKLYKIIDSLTTQDFINLDLSYNNRANSVLSKNILELFKSKECIDSIKIIIDAYDCNKEKILKTPKSHWTLDNMGPIVIPKKGMEILLNPTTFVLYEKAIRLFEKSALTEDNGTYFCNGKKITTYKFKLNYYFMMGDNRKETMDSRSWGFLPETNIIGKVHCVLFSNKNEEFEWDRLFKIL